MYQEYWDALTRSLWSAESWAKVLFLLVTSPFWWPIVKSMWHEAHEVLAPEGGLYANKKPRPIAPRERGDDPFVNIPRPSHRNALLRRRGGANTGSSGRSAGVASPGAARSRAVAGRRRGF